jgi:DNA-binding winged helix-turn-helix (wHTH) protein/tetratricopeptide (TPR) repeat protein
METHKFGFSEYVFDAKTGALTRKDRKLHLPEQTARLLAVLLERANTLVTREELRTALWPNEEFLDYEQGINTAVNRLRNAIRDSSRNPPFIKTIPKRGYSFQGEVKRLDSPLLLAISSGSEPATGSQQNAALRLRPDSSQPAANPGGVARSAATPAPRPHPPRGWVVPVISFSLAAILIAAPSAFYLQHRKASPHPLRLGIAPFQAHGDAQTGEVSEDLRLQIADAISRLPGVEVRAAVSNEENSRPAAFVPGSAGASGTDEFLLGSIVQEGTVYDLRFELARAADMVHLASFEYSGSRQELPAIGNRLQQDLFYYLQSQSTTVQAAKGSTNDAQAYDLYLRGASGLFDRNPDSLKQSLDDFRQAIARDPAFALAYAGMATTYLKLSPYDEGSQDLLDAQESARRALKIDPLLAQAHAVLGYVAFARDWDFNQGERELRYAILEDPSQADYRDWLSVLLVDQGRFDEGLGELSMAKTGDPRWPSVYAMEGLMGGYARRNAEAIAAGRKYLELLPALPIAHDTLAWIYFQSARYSDAIGEWRQMALLQNDAARIQLEDRGRKVLESEGIRAYARLRLEAIRQNRGVNQRNDFVPAEWYACAGMPDEAIAQLSTLVASRNQYVLGIAVNPLYDSLHDDPRFQELLKTIGLKLPGSSRNLNSHLCEEPRKAYVPAST